MAFACPTHIGGSSRARTEELCQDGFSSSIACAAVSANRRIAGQPNAMETARWGLTCRRAEIANRLQVCDAEPRLQLADNAVFKLGRLSVRRHPNNRALSTKQSSDLKARASRPTSHSYCRERHPPDRRGLRQLTGPTKGLGSWTRLAPRAGLRFLSGKSDDAMG